MAFNLFGNILNKVSNVTGIGLEDKTQSSLYKALAPYEQTAQNVTGALQDTARMYEQKAQNISQWSQNVSNKPGYIRLGQMIKRKYPEYNDLSDEELGQKMLAKYPEYQDIVSGETTALGYGAKALGGIGSMAVSAPGMVTGGAEQLGTGIGTIASAQSGQDVAKGALQAGKGALQAGFGVATGAMPISSTVFGGATGFDTVQQGMGYVGQKAGDLSANTAKFLGGNEGVQEQARGFGEIAVPALALKGVSVGGKYAKPIVNATGRGIVKGVDTVAPKVVQKVSDVGGAIIKTPQKIVKSGVNTLEKIKPGIKDDLANIDPQSRYAVERATPERVSSIIDEAKQAKMNPEADYNQTPYHKGAEMANKTVDQIEGNLRKRQGERMAILENVPLEKVNLENVRNSLKSELDKLNIEDITIDDAGKPVVVSKQGRSALLDSKNSQDMQAIEKLREILSEDVSPLQTMDNIKILQEWLYENKGTIALKGISKKMEGIVSKIQGSLNKTFKDQLPPEYKKVMDSMSEDIQMNDKIKRLFGIDDSGNQVGNRGELVMKRLTNGTTTGGEARALAKEILDKYGIDLIQEARLRQLSMELVGDTRGANLFGVLLSGKKGMMDWTLGKVGDLLINKENLIKSYAGKGTIIKPKKQSPLYTKPKQNGTPIRNTQNNTPISDTKGSTKVTPKKQERDLLQEKYDAEQKNAKPIVIKKPIVKPNTIKNESKVSEPVVVPKKTVNTPIVEKTATEVIKPKNSIYTSQEKAESYVKWHEKELQNPGISKKSITYLKKGLEDAKQEVELWKSLNKSNAKQQGITPRSTTTNVFGETIKKPSNKKGGFIKIPEIGKKIPVKNPLVEEARKTRFIEDSKKALQKWSPRKGGYEIKNIKLEDTNVYPAKSRYDTPVYKQYDQYKKSDSVEYWMKRIKEGDTPPPVVVEKRGDKFYVWDGHHRMVAAEESGLKNIDAIVIEKPLEKGNDKKFISFSEKGIENLTKKLEDFYKSKTIK